jgi:hypothetical protein
MSELIKGIYRDRLLDAGGGAVFDSGWRKNMIVMNCRVLIAGLLKDDPDESPLGIQSLKLGRGSASWDALPPASPDPDTMTQLVEATPYVIPRSALTLRYLNASNEISNAPTNRLEVIATLGPGEPAPGPNVPSPYLLREFGLFGKLKGADYMIDYIRHPLIEKDSAVTLERRVQLIF